MTPPPDQTPPPNRKVIATMTVPLKCMLTPHDVGKKQASLLECHRKLRSHEQHEANVKAQLKRDRTAIESEMGAVVGVLESGYEMRDTVVEKIADYEAGLVRHIRVDTGDEVDVERMSEAQKQTELDLREKRDAEASRPTNPDDVAPDSDPWGAPADGRPPVAELPHDPDVIDAEFVEGYDAEGAPDDDDDTDEGEYDPSNSTGDDAEPAPETHCVHGVSVLNACNDCHRDPSTTNDAGISSDALRIKHLVEWLPGQGGAVAREYLETAEVEDVRAIYAMVVGEPAGRAQRRSMIPKIVDRLFNAPF